MAVGFLLLKATVILSLALVLDVYLRRRAVLACAAMWNTVLVAIAFLPATVLVLPPLKVPLLRAGGAPVAVSPSFNTTEGDSPSPERVLAPFAETVNLFEPRPAMAREQAAFKFSWSSAITTLYFVGVGVCLLRLVIGLIAVRSVLAKSAPVASADWQGSFAYWKGHLACGPVELRQSPNVELPLMAGLFRPAVLLPERLAIDLAPESRDAVIVHELAHVLRTDFGWHLLLRLVQAALWFHPLIWLAERRIHFIRERACDEFSVHALGSSEQYAETLLAIASRINGRPRLSLGLAVVRTPYIAARIEALAGSHGIARCQLPTHRRILALVACLALSAFVGSLSIVEAQQPAAQGQTEPQRPASPVAAKSQPVNDSEESASAGKEPAKEGGLGNQEPQTRKMRVQVLSVDDEPLPGATVFANVTLADPVRINNREYICDAAGKATLELPIEPIDMLRLWADREGRVGWHAHWWPKYQPDGHLIPDEYTFRLEKGTVIGGIVKNDAGHPIEGATVSVSLVQPLAADFQVRTFRSIYLAGLDSRHDTRRTTDAAGRWTLDNVPAGDDVEVLLKVSHPDHLGYEEWGGLQKGQGVSMKSLRERTGTIMMRRIQQIDEEKQATATQRGPEPANSAQAAISGQVTIANGSPVVGATVFLRDGGLHRATTDEQGQFHFTEAPLRNYEIWAVKEPLIAELQRLTAEQPAAAGGRRFPPVKLAMSPGKEIHVSVTSLQTGRPIEGARVALEYPYRQNQATDKDGKTALKGLLAQPHRMTIEAAGHARVLREIDLRSAEPITMHTASLALGGTVRGVVTDENGQPLPDANVVYRTPDSSVGFYGDSPKADKEGAYRNLYLPLDTPVRLMVSLEDYVNHRQELLLTEQQRDLTVNIELKRRPRGGSVTGTVTDADGQPIANASVMNAGTSPSEKRGIQTDATGKFTINDVVSGPAGYELVIRAADYATTRQRFEPATNEPLTIKLAKGHFIRARVQNRAGQPIAGAFVDINGGSNNSQAGESLRTDKEGQFSSTSLPASAVFHIYASGYSSIDKTTLALDSEETVVVTLGPMGVIQGQVVDESGNPIKQFRVRLGFASRRSGDISESLPSKLINPGTLFHSPEGRFSIPELTSGMPLTVTVEAEGFEPARLLRVVARPENEAPLTKITITKPGSIDFATLSGTVVDHEGNPVSGVQLRLIASSRQPAGEHDNLFNWVLIETGQLGQKDYVDQYLSSVTDNDGKFEWKNVLPGKFVQVAYWGDRAPKGRTLNIAKTESGGSERILIKLPKPAIVRFSFDTPDFPTAVSARLMHSAIQAFLSYEMNVPKEKSEFSFANLPPGEYWLTLTGPAERNPTQPQMFSHPNLASRKLKIEEGNTYDVHLSKADQTKRRN